MGSPYRSSFRTDLISLLVAWLQRVDPDVLCLQTSLMSAVLRRIA